MLDAEFVKAVKDLSVKAADPQQRVIRVPGDAPHVYYLLNPDGTAEKKEHAQPRERSAVLSIPALCAWLSDRGDNDTAVWYSRAGVVALDHTENARTTFALTPSAPLKLLADIAGRQDGIDYEQVTLWRLLRTTFRDCLPSHPNLKEQVGRVDVKKAQEASGNVDRKGTSVSRKLMAEASGADQLPEVLTFDVPVFAEALATARALVRVAFDFDAQAERFKLCVLPGEIDKAHAAGEKWLNTIIGQELGDRGIEGVPVFHGQPE
jgi:hypothetical protein